MIKLKQIVYSLSLVMLLISCGPAPQHKKLTYQNIVILSDLSSRTTNKPLKDLDEINKIIQYFKNECVKPGEKIGDRSSILFSTFSDKDRHAIDLSEIKDLGKKQQFINSTGEYADTGLAQAMVDFETNIKSVYLTKTNPGLDLISMLMEKIEEDNLIKKDMHFTNRLDSTYINFDNHIYIFTDGYLEYKNRSRNDQFYFGVPEIEKVRQYCIAHTVDIETALEMNDNLCLPATTGRNNEYINLHILETQERDKNDLLQTYKYPKGQRDNEILRAVWEKWAMDSRFKSFSWGKY